METLPHIPVRHHHHHNQHHLGYSSLPMKVKSSTISHWDKSSQNLSVEERGHKQEGVESTFFKKILEHGGDAVRQVLQQPKTSIFRREAIEHINLHDSSTILFDNSSDLSILLSPVGNLTNLSTWGEIGQGRVGIYGASQGFFETCPPVPESPYQKVVYSIIVPLMLLFCTLSFIINMVIVISIRWCRKPLSPTLYFSISLALADAFASVVLGTGLILNSLLVTVYSICLTSQCIPLALEAFRLGGVLITVAHLLALAINHWFGIVRPLQYEATMTRGTALRIIIFSWMCPILGFLLSFATIHDQGFHSFQCKNQDFLHRKVFHLIFGVFFFFPLILMTVIYCHIFIIVRDHLRHRIKFQGCIQLRKNVKAIVTTFLILGTYIICWMPAVLWYVLVCYDCLITEVDAKVALPVNITINMLIILKAFVNPIIYAARMQDIQSALKKMRYELGCWLLKLCSSRAEIERDDIGSVRFTKSFRITSRGSISQSNL